MQKNVSLICTTKVHNLDLFKLLYKILIAMRITFFYLKITTGLFFEYVFVLSNINAKQATEYHIINDKLELLSITLLTTLLYL